MTSLATQDATLSQEALRPQKPLRTRPRYAPRGGERIFAASFGPGEPCFIEQGRERSYPGLTSPAPCTRSLYAGFAAWLPAPMRIWDVGCGSGSGTLLLTERGHQVVGIDVDENALHFARCYFPEGDFRGLSSDTLKSEPQPDVVVLVDVLGFCEDPRRLLWQLRQLAPEARLLLAEPRATPGQSLVAPQRQAFSIGSLKRSVLRAGYRLQDHATNGTFIALSATPADFPTGRAFEQAFRARSDGAYDTATAVLEPLVLQTSNEVAREVHLELAELFSEKMDGERASANYLSVLQLDPNDADALSGLAQLTLASGNPREALGLALRAVELDPSSAAAACSLGLTAERFSMGEAFRAWQLAASLAPAEPITLTRLAELANAVGHKELAICALERLRHYHTDQGADFYVTLGWLLLAAGRTEDAKLEAKVAYTLAPESPEVQQLQDRFDELRASVT